MLKLKENKIELKTSKGKALQLIITTDDPSESDIEEIKEILNRAYEKNLKKNLERRNNIDKKKNFNENHVVFNRDKPFSKSASNLLENAVEDRKSTTPSNKEKKDLKKSTKSSNSFVSSSSLELLKSETIKTQYNKTAKQSLKESALK